MTGNESAIQAAMSPPHAAACPSFDALSAYFDGELPDADLRAIRSHVASCERCGSIVADFRIVNSMLNSAETSTLPRSFTLTESMIAGPSAPPRSPTPAASFERATRRLRSVSFLPVMTAIAALLLVAVISGEAWSGNNGSAPPSAQTTSGDSGNVLMIGGVPVTIDDDASYGAASAGAMNTGEGAASAAASSPRQDDSRDWFNWWRPFEAVLGLTVVALLVTMVSRRRPRHARTSETSPIR
jgi:hypothetical protein